MNVLVIGATGKTGRPVVEALVARGAKVTAASRNPGPAGGGIVPVRFDWADRATWEPALAGADALYLVGPFTAPEPEGLVGELLAMANNARRVVLLSVHGADRLPSAVPMAAWEEEVRQSDKQWVVLRPNWFQQNFGTSFAGLLRDHGLLELPAGDAAPSFVDTRDVADVAAAALLADDHAGRVLDLTGPQSLTHGEALAILGAASARDMAYVPITPELFAGRLSSARVPERSIAWQLGLFQAMRDGVNNPVTDVVQQVAGHPARSLARYAAEHADAWRIATTQ